MLRMQETLLRPGDFLWGGFRVSGFRVQGLGLQGLDLRLPSMISAL